MSDFGEVKRWRNGDVLYAENDVVRMAYVVTDDPQKIGRLMLYEPEQLYVEGISAETAKLWSAA